MSAREEVSPVVVLTAVGIGGAEMISRPVQQDAKDTTSSAASTFP
jgi:hypothetical protein